jgi:hypothetical protein
MSSVLDRPVSRYASCYERQAGSIPLLEWLQCRDYDPLLAQLRREADPHRRRELKKMLPAVTPSGEFSTRSAAGLLRHSGLICVDIDRKDNLHIGNFDALRGLFAQLPQVAYFGRSASGEGYFCIIPLAHPRHHALHFDALRADFAGAGLVIDAACRDVCRLRWYASDPQAYYNHSAIPYRKLPSKLPRQLSRAAFDLPANHQHEAIGRAIGELHRRRHDLTANYHDWIRIGFAFASLGEEGRAYYHAVSALHPGYDPRLTDRKFDHLLNSYRGDISLGTFFRICQEQGVSQSDP